MSSINDIENQLSKNSDYTNLSNTNSVTNSIGQQITKNIKSDVFVNIRDTKQSSGIKSNLLLFRIGREYRSYCVKRLKNGKIFYEIPSDEEVKMYESYLDTACNKMCKFTVSKNYIKDEYNNVPVSVMVFSTGKPRPYRVGSLASKSRKSTLKSRLVITGLLTMINKKSRNGRGLESMYIPLICSKGGQGSSLLMMAEELTKILGYKRIEMTSLDTPLGFYLHKGYNFVDGKDTYILPDKDRLSIYSEIYDKTKGGMNIKERKLSKKNRSKIAYINDNGRLYNNKNIPSISSLKSGSSKKKMRNRLKTSRVAKNIGNVLHKIKYVEGQGIYLFKNL